MAFAASNDPCIPTQIIRNQISNATIRVVHAREKRERARTVENEKTGDGFGVPGYLNRVMMAGSKTPSGQWVCSSAAELVVDAAPSSVVVALEESFALTTTSE